jgi:hypothetical protein
VVGVAPQPVGPQALAPSQTDQKAHHLSVKGFEVSVRGWCQEEVEAGWGARELQGSLGS